MKRIFKSNLARYFVPNIGTLILMALMLFVYRASAAPGSPPTVSDAIPGTISYQGMLNDAAGQPINGNIGITFRLYNTPTGATSAALWMEAHTSANTVPVSNGLFNVLLGSLNPIPASVWSNTNVYLGVQVGNDAEMAPRESIGAVPRAQTSDYAQNVSSMQGGVITAQGDANLPDSSEWTDAANLSAIITLEKPSTVFVSGHAFVMQAPNSLSELRVVIGDSVSMFVRYQNGWGPVPLHHTAHLAPGSYTIKVQSRWNPAGPPGTSNGIIGFPSELSYFILPDVSGQ